MNILLKMTANKVFYKLFKLSVLGVLSFSVYAVDSNNQRLETVMEKFLGMTCYDGEIEKRLIAELKSNANNAEVYFMELINKGPTKELIEVQIKYSKEQYAISNRFFENKKRSVQRVSDEKVKMTLRNEKDYVNNEIKMFTLRLKVRALEALKKLGTPKSLMFIRDLSKNKKFELRDIAEELTKS